MGATSPALPSRRRSIRVKILDWARASRSFRNQDAYSSVFFRPCHRHHVLFIRDNPIVDNQSQYGWRRDAVPRAHGYRLRRSSGSLFQRVRQWLILTMKYNIPSLEIH
jgi:hypothetical protein